MEDQAEHRRRKPLATDGARFEQSRFRSARELLQRALNGGTPPANERFQRRTRVRDLTLSRQRRELRRRQRFTTRVRQQAICASLEVSKVEPYRRGAAGARPCFFRCEAFNRTLHVLAHVNERVSRRL